MAEKKRSGKKASGKASGKSQSTDVFKGEDNDAYQAMNRAQSNDINQKPSAGTGMGDISGGTIGAATPPGSPVPPGSSQGGRIGGDFSDEPSSSSSENWSESGDSNDQNRGDRDVSSDSTFDGSDTDINR